MEPHLALGTAAFAITAACLTPNRYLPRLPNDKLMHAAAFGLLTWLALPLAAGAIQIAACLAAVFAIGVLIEVLQEWLVPDRHFCWRDLLANAAGIGLAAAVSLMYAAA